MKVKICGLKNPAAVTAAVESGADYLGFVFAESKRQVSGETVAKLTANLPQTIQKVGVFVSPTIDELIAISRVAGLDMLQIHGELPVELTGTQPVLDLPVIRAFSVTEGKLPTAAFTESYDYLLLDAPAKEFIGGNGEVFDWSAVDLTQLPAKPLFVAGGLTSENVQSARNYFQPFAVDVSSGVETAGEKDLNKIHQFITQAKSEQL